MKSLPATQITGIWVSSPSALILRWGSETGVTFRQEIKSEVEPHRRATGRPPYTEKPSNDHKHDEQMRAFFAQIIAVLPAGDDLLLVGDGEVVGHLGQAITTHEHGRPDPRRLEVVKSKPLTEPQLLARIREFAGEPAARMT
jgi:hypothetical protein